MSPARAKRAEKLLDELEMLFLSSVPTTEQWESVQASRARAACLVTPEMGAEGVNLAAVVFVADALSALALERSWSAAELRTLMATAAELTGLPVERVATETYLRLVRSPVLLELPPQVAAESHLKLLLLFSAATEASLWLSDASGPLRCVAAAGDGKPGQRARVEARRTVEEGDREARRGRGWFHGVPVTRWQTPSGALVIRVRPGDRAWALSLAEEAAAVLGLILERDILIRRGRETERALVESTERRLVRLGLDLHDGPLQDVAALAGELRHFRRQLPRLIAEAPLERVLGRIDDIEARLYTADRDLRELARSFESPAILKRPFVQALREDVEEFQRRSGVPAALRLKGDFRGLTGSQRIALFRIIQEALTNVREHSEASQVEIALVARRGRVTLEIADNGRGFDVEETLMRAARRGSLGLVGMSVRVRLLGGVFHIQSRPGGPTTIAVVLPEWRALGESRQREPDALEGQRLS